MSQEQRKQKKIDAKITEIQPLLEDFVTRIALTYGIRIVPVYSEKTLSHGMIVRMGHFNFMELTEEQIKAIREVKEKKEEPEVKPQLEIV